MMIKSKEKLCQTLALITVGANEISLAIGNGWVSPFLTSLPRSTVNFSLTIKDCSWIASLSQIGKIFGAFLSAFLIDVIGRKLLLICCSATFLTLWLIILFTESISVIFVVRFIFGVACGINDVTCSAYLGEISLPLIRGLFGTISISIYYFGILMEFTIASVFSYHTTALINSVIEFIAFLSIFWLIEPCQYLLMKGKYQQAEKNFLRLKGARHLDEVKDEYEKIKKNALAEKNKKSSIHAILTSPANYRSFCIMITISSLVGSTGYIPILSYASILFISTDIISPDGFTILLGLFQFTVIVTTSFFVSQWDRRAILLTSFFLISVIHASIAVLYYIQEKLCTIPYFSLIIFFAVTLFCGTFAFAFPAIFIIRSELFPLSIKAFGSCVSVVGYSAMNFITTKIFLFVSQQYGVHVNFIIFSTVSLILVLFVYLILPETRNKTLIDIQQLLETN